MSTTTYYAWDRTHRLTTRWKEGGEAHYFAYNQRNDVTGIVDHNGAGDAPRSFAFNALGERVVAKDNSAGNPAYWSYDGWKFLQDREQGGSVNRKYRHNDDPQGLDGIFGSLTHSIQAGFEAVLAQDQSGSSASESGGLFFNRDQNFHGEPIQGGSFFRTAFFQPFGHVEGATNLRFTWDLDGGATIQNSRVKTGGVAGSGADDQADLRHAHNGGGSWDGPPTHDDEELSDPQVENCGAGDFWRRIGEGIDDTKSAYAKDGLLSALEEAYLVSIWAPFELAPSWAPTPMKFYKDYLTVQRVAEDSAKLPYAMSGLDASGYAQAAKNTILDLVPGYRNFARAYASATAGYGVLSIETLKAVGYASDGLMDVSSAYFGLKYAPQLHTPLTGSGEVRISLSLPQWLKARKPLAARLSPHLSVQVTTADAVATSQLAAETLEVAGLPKQTPFSMTGKSAIVVSAQKFFDGTFVGANWVFTRRVSGTVAKAMQKAMDAARKNMAITKSVTGRTPAVGAYHWLTNNCYTHVTDIVTTGLAHAAPTAGIAAVSGMAPATGQGGSPYGK